MALIRNKIHKGVAKPALIASGTQPGSNTLKSQQNSSTNKASESGPFQNSKENWSFLANSNLHSKSKILKNDSSSIGNHLKQPSVDGTRTKTGSKIGESSEMRMMSRIGWLFELRNLFDKIKRKSTNGVVPKDLFLNQLRRAAGVVQSNIVHGLDGS